MNRLVQTPDGRIHHIISDRDLNELIDSYLGREIAEMLPSFQEHDDEDYVALEQEFKAYEQDIEAYRDKLWETKELLEQLQDKLDDNPRFTKQKAVVELSRIEEGINKIL